MAEAGPPEVEAHLRRERLVLAERHAAEQGRLAGGRAGGERRVGPEAEAIDEPVEPAPAPAVPAQRGDEQDGVRPALTGEEIGGSWPGEPPRGLRERADRRNPGAPPRRDGEQDALPGSRARGEPRRQPAAEAPGTRRLEHLELDRADVPEARPERRAVERREATLGTARAADERHRADQRGRRPPAEERDGEGCSEHDRRRRRDPAEQQPGHEGAEGEVARTLPQGRHARGQALRCPYGDTCGRSAASFFAPMPGMRSSSSTEPKPPCATR